MQRRLSIAIAVGSVASFAVAGLANAGPEFDNKYENTTVTRNCGNGDTVVYGGPEKMWPPNHKLQDVDVTATDGQGMNVSLEVTPSVTDVAGGDGGPHHDPDVFFPAGPAASGQGSATVPVQLRSERSGKGDGHTYTLHWAAEFKNGLKMCSSMQADQEPFTVFVPHDMRGGRDW